MGVNFDNIKFRASSWGNLLAEPQLKSEKDAGKLGLSCQKELLRIYRKEVYDWEEDDVTTLAMEKGTLVQTQSILMYSAIMDKDFKENGEQLENDWFKGTPDVFLGETIKTATQVDDMKNSVLLNTFTDKTVETVTKDQKCQLNVYYSLTGASGGNIVHTLVSLPYELFKVEADRLLWQMTNKGIVSTEYAPEYIEAVEKLKKKYYYENIPPEERIFIQPVPRDEELIQKMKEKVPVLRQWLFDYHKSLKNRADYFKSM